MSVSREGLVREGFVREGFVCVSRGPAMRSCEEARDVRSVYILWKQTETNKQNTVHFFINFY